jgi:hypothetical protein
MVDGVWVECYMKDLRVGDVFRMFDGPGPVIGTDGAITWEVISEPAPRARVRHLGDRAGRLDLGGKMTNTNTNTNTGDRSPMTDTIDGARVGDTMDPTVIAPESETVDDYVGAPFAAEIGTWEWVDEASDRYDRSIMEFSTACMGLAAADPNSIAQLLVLRGILGEAADRLVRTKWMQREIIRSIEKLPSRSGGFVICCDRKIDLAKLMDGTVPIQWEDADDE